MPMRYGLKMTPPPRPRAPATKPPPKPSANTPFKTLPLKTRSLLTKFTFSYFYFKVCSLATSLTATTTPITIKTTNKLMVIQSAAVHFLKTVFLQMFIAILNIRSMPFKACFFHMQWPCSCLISDLNSRISLSFSASPVGRTGKPYSSFSVYAKT